MKTENQRKAALYAIKGATTCKNGIICVLTQEQIDTIEAALNTAPTSEEVKHVIDKYNDLSQKNSWSSDGIHEHLSSEDISVLIQAVKPSTMNVSQLVHLLDSKIFIPFDIDRIERFYFLVSVIRMIQAIFPNGVKIIDEPPESK